MVKKKTIYTRPELEFFRVKAIAQLATLSSSADFEDIDFQESSFEDIDFDRPS